ncbi:hypothetical protein LY76DRAFT_348640 [Colletotrichum caudatum]|nr:hypothetical protein LY76DRAFT_348640 [Colletotrichum caudatum]
MCQSNDANTVCRLPITRFSGSKDRHRAGIPFCIDTKATILSFLAEHGVTLDILPTGRCSDYTFLAGLRARCFLAQGSDFERVVNERFASLVKSLARRADREGMIANARWCAPAATWKPHDFAVWLRGHCAMKNHWERPPSGVRHMPQAQQQHLPGLQPSSPTSDPQSKLLHMMGGLCLSEPPVDDSVLDELLASLPASSTQTRPGQRRRLRPPFPRHACNAHLSANRSYTRPMQAGGGLHQTNNLRARRAVPVGRLGSRGGPVGRSGGHNGRGGERLGRREARLGAC